MCRLQVLLTVVCLGLVLVFVPGAQAEPVSPDNTIILAPQWHFETNQAADISVYDHRELDVAAGCDVNGDGYKDVIVGDRDYDYLYARDDNGRAWLFYGSAAGLSATPARTFDPPYTNNYGFFGTRVWCDVDVNNDGFDDILIAMDNYEASYADEGAVYVWYGSATGPTSGYNWMARGNATYAHFGISLDSAGDVNGDNFDDIIVIGWDYYAETTVARVWHGGTGGLGASNRAADWTATVGGGIGFLARGIGDVNGDGWDDVMLGTHNYDGSFTDQGAVYVWYGSATGLGPSGTVANADWSAFGGQASAYFGWAGDGVGDLNGDGYDDLAVGAYGYDSGETNEGAVFVWYGSASGLGLIGSPGNADWSAESNAVSAQLGYSLRPAGDVNGDGYADLIAGAYAYPVASGGGTLAAAGAWFVWLGSAAGLGNAGTPGNSDFAGYGDQAQGRLGRDDVAAGDVNGDGFSDIFAAAYMYDMGETDEGVVFGYYSPRRLFLPLVLRNYP
jgi:hypothetical protein